MSKVKHKDLTETAKELNNELGLDPAIDVKGNSNILRRKIAEAAEHIIPEEDELSENTWTVLRALELVNDSGDEKTQEEGEETEAPATEDQPEEEEEGEVPYEIINEGDEEAPEEEKPKQSEKSNKPSNSGKKSKKGDVERTAFGSKTTSSAAEIDNILLSTDNPLSIPEIVKRSRCQHSRVSSHVRTLVSKGYVEDVGKGADELGHNSIKRYVRKG